jgi:small multidrug resistance pump
MVYFFLALLVVVNTLAGVFVKIGSSNLLGQNTVSIWSLIFNWYYFLGVSFYCLSFILFAYCLGKLPLNVVHPVATAGSIVLVAICSYFLFLEPFSLSKILGLLACCVGIVLIVS